MKIGIGKSRKFIIDGKERFMTCTAMKYEKGKHLLYLRDQKPPHESFWYDHKNKLKTA